MQQRGGQHGAAVDVQYLSDPVVCVVVQILVDPFVWIVVGNYVFYHINIGMNIKNTNINTK